MVESLIPREVLIQLIRTAVATPPGPWVEVGVYQGGSALELYAARDKRQLHLFDTFIGIPVCDPALDQHGIGEFNGEDTYSELLHQMPFAQFHVGVFPATLRDDLQDIAFAHIDCDQYRSVSDCITSLWSRVIVGGTMWFDDYYDLIGARQAVMEHFTDDQLYLAAGGRRFVIK